MNHFTSILSITFLLLLAQTSNAATPVDHAIPVKNSSQALSQDKTNQVLSFTDYKQQVDQVMKQKQQRQLAKNVFQKKAQSDFLNNDVKLDETKDQFIYKIDIPRLHHNGVQVFIRHNAIVLYHKSNLAPKKDSLSKHLYKKRFGTYHRVIPLPKNAIKKSLQPIERNGSLTITIDKI